MLSFHVNVGPHDSEGENSLYRSIKSKTDLKKKFVDALTQHCQNE